MQAVTTELKARDVMTPDPVCVPPSATMRELARAFEEHEISGVPVVNQEGKVVGIVSKTDLIRRCATGTDEFPPAYLFEVLGEQGAEEQSSEVIPEPLMCVDDFMTEDPLVVSPAVPAETVARLMVEKRIHRVVVVEQGVFPIGIITSMDLLGAFTRPR